MAHWVAVVNQQAVSAQDTKTKAIQEISNIISKHSPSLAGQVAYQLAQSEGASIAYGRDRQEIAKVLPCNCGSKRKHRS